MGNVNQIRHFGTPSPGAIYNFTTQSFALSLSFLFHYACQSSNFRTILFESKFRFGFLPITRVGIIKEVSGNTSRRGYRKGRGRGQFSVAIPPQISPFRVVPKFQYSQKKPFSRIRMRRFHLFH